MAAVSSAARLQAARRIVVKIGSALLVAVETGRLRIDWLEALAADVAELRGQGRQVILVSSGSIALGRRALRLSDGALSLEQSQAAAAVGQIRLAQAYETVLAPHGITTAQVLVTLEDSENRRRYLNSRRTLGTLLDLGVVPIVNENDTVATDEIRYGDNDRLAAQVASMAGADVLVLLSDVDGLYTANPRHDPQARRLDRVTAITPEIEAMAGGTGSALSRGGMKTKLIAARAAMRAGCAMAITAGAVERPLTALASGAPCTWFEPDGDPHAARKRWISGMKPRGRVTRRRRRGGGARAGQVAAAGRRHRGRGRVPARRPDRGDRPGRGGGRQGARGLRCLRGATHHGPPLGPDRRTARPPGPRRAGPPRRSGVLGGCEMDVRLDVKSLMQDIGEKARAAAADLAFAPSAQKDAALRAAADAIADDRAAVLAANATDMELAEAKGLGGAMLDRLLLTEARVDGMVAGLRAIADQPDPVGQVMAEWDRPSGLHIRRVRTPIGVIGVIFESRPNVTADAGALCLKAGNAAILRGGSESLHSSRAIHAGLAAGLAAAGLPEGAIQLVPTTDRAAVGEMLTMTRYIDVLVPRGGKGLVGRVQAEARVPVFAHLEGIVHIYVDRAADLAKARRVILNAKTRRTGICGAAECVLIDRGFYESEGAPFLADLIEAGVEVRGDDTLLGLPGVVPAGHDDWGREFLDMIIAARLVDGVDGAIAHIRRYGSSHTDCILTEDDAAAARFFERLDSAILMRNASTQFADGGEFGMGAEIGIATGKLHARGPVGAEQLTSFKYLVEGDGTIRP